MLEIAEAELRQQYEELTATRAAAEAERQRYRELLEFAPDAYVVTDTRGIIREANAAAAALFNVPRRFLSGKPLLLTWRTPIERRWNPPSNGCAAVPPEMSGRSGCSPARRRVPARTPLPAR